MKKKTQPIIVLIILSFLIASCAPIRMAQEAEAATATRAALQLTATQFNPNVLLSSTRTPTSPVESSPTQSEAELPSPSPTANPTPTPTIETPPSTTDQVLPPEWQAVQDRMQSYGQIQEDYLSESYRQRMAERISRYGKARNILTLELHGNNYDMYEGRYSLTPEAFRAQIDYLMANDYHFATLHEVEGFVYGRFDLPVRSVILTADISSQTVSSLDSISGIFSDLEKVYGYQPHMLVFPWTGDMRERPGVACEADSCWKALQDALASGYFTFGSHSTNHPDFSTVGYEQLETDWQTSQVTMQNNLGLSVYALAWPFEVCSSDVEAMQSMGFTLGWGGSTKPLEINYTAANDPRPLCLPRLFPPAPNGISMRPEGQTLQQMLEGASTAP